MNPEDYVSYPLALALKKAGFDLEVNHVYDKNGELWEEGMNENAECDYTAYFNYNKSGYIEVSASAPTLAQAQKWLRDRRGIHIDVYIYSDYSTDADGKVCDRWCFWGFELYAIGNAERVTVDDGEYDSYEQTLSAGIAAALDFLGNEKE